MTGHVPTWRSGQPFVALAGPAGPVTLHVDELALRPWRADDAGVVAALSQDPQIRQWNPLRSDGADVTDFDAWCARQADWTDSARVSWAITARDTGDAVLGYATLHHLDWANRTGEAGYWVGAAHRRRGLARRALRVMTDYAGSRLGFRSLELCHAVANEASCRVAVSAGYTGLAVEAGSSPYGDGLLHPEHRHRWTMTRRPP